jgi:cyclic-di-GMP phosphodiesterase TipF (flagellum assembly factor)
MTRKIGLRAGAGQRVAIIAGGVSALLLAVALLLVLAPGNPALIALSAITGASVALAATALLRARRLEAQAAKLSGDLDIVSLRLLRLEAVPAMAAKEAKPDARLADSVDEITAEIGLMGGILRDLANAVAAHDRDLASVRGGIGRSAPPRPAPAPTRADPAPAPEARPVETPAAKPARAVPEPGPDRPVAAILDAFAADRLELHLQPVVALPQRKVRFYEALARLRLADETLLVPAEFLPVLEERRLMPELDRKVLARTATIARHLASRGSDALVACNIAPAGLRFRAAAPRPRRGAGPGAAASRPGAARPGREAGGIAAPARGSAAEDALPRLPAPRELSRPAVPRRVGSVPYSITSSARSRKPAGISSPSALAARPLMTNSNLLGCSTGRSAGLAPFNILST